MNNKIPPPIVTLFFGCCIYFSRDYFLNVNIQWLSILSYAFFIAGITALFLALRLFKKKETTVNPIKIETASSLVTSGIFNYSRNPMYLGMALILIGLSLKFNLIGGFVFTAFFMLFITYFQIRPEEKAMHEIFGEEFLNYKENVRMWL
jgi:protein-S-isoprenylcysteine O-methyltransferase Ste14